MAMQPYIAAANALRYVLDAAAGDRLVVFCDPEKQEIGRAFAHGALDLGLWTRIVVLDAPPIDKAGPRKLVPPFATEILVRGEADIYINLFRGPAEEVPFRIRFIQLESRRRVRLGHCPGITLEMMTEGALALEQAEYEKMQGQAVALLSRLRGVHRIHLSNGIGTDLTFSVKGRDFFTDTKVDWRTLKWMNLPVGEVIAGPVEDSLDGKLVCDVAVGGIGVIRKPVTIMAKGGRAAEVQCDDEAVRSKILAALDTDLMARHVGEFAFGLNHKARLSSEFLEIEKLGGTCHIAFGNNSDYPSGQNTSANHMDFLISSPTVEADWGEGFQVLMKDGKLK